MCELDKRIDRFYKDNEIELIKDWFAIGGDELIIKWLDQKDQAFLRSFLLMVFLSSGSEEFLKFKNWALEEITTRLEGDSESDKG